MRKKVFALLISDEDKSFETLRDILKCLGIEVWSVQSREEVASLMDQTQPELIFTSTTFPDGTWSDIVRLSEKTYAPPNVIVVGKHRDTKLYLSTMDGGAFDFILPPFEAEPLAHITRVAAENARRRRDEHAIKAVA